MKVAIIILGLIFFSCNKKCDCSDSWNPQQTYYKGSSVKHNGKCWIALEQGRGIEPGPWMQNGNDIWEECN